MNAFSSSSPSSPGDTLCYLYAAFLTKVSQSGSRAIKKTKIIEGPPSFQAQMSELALAASLHSSSKEQAGLGLWGDCPIGGTARFFAMQCMDAPQLGTQLIMRPRMVYCLRTRLRMGRFRLKLYPAVKLWLCQLQVLSPHSLTSLTGLL